jgi:hypothetical protein
MLQHQGAVQAGVSRLIQKWAEQPADTARKEG